MWHVGSSSLTRDRTWDPALGAQGLSHWTTRKVSFTESWVEERRIESFFHNQMGPSKNKKILPYSSPYTQCPPHFPPWPRLDHDLTLWRLFFWKRTQARFTRMTFRQHDWKGPWPKDHSTHPAVLRTLPVPRHLGLTHACCEDPVPDARIAFTLLPFLTTVLWNHP